MILNFQQGLCRHDKLLCLNVMMELKKLINHKNKIIVSKTIKALIIIQNNLLCKKCYQEQNSLSYVNKPFKIH